MNHPMLRFNLCLEFFDIAIGTRNDGHDHSGKAVTLETKRREEATMPKLILRVVSAEMEI